MKRFLFVVLLVSNFCVAAAIAGGNAAAGKEKSKTCVACHGETGVSPTAQFPIIAGQHKDYLYQALSDYKAGNRKNPVMAGIVAALNDQDMHDLAAFYASQDGLHSIELPDSK